MMRLLGPAGARCAVLLVLVLAALASACASEPRRNQPTPIVARGTNVQWTVARVRQVETITGRDVRLRSDDLDTWLVLELQARNVGDQTINLHERNIKLRFQPEGTSDWIERVPDPEATGAASQEYHVQYIGSVLGSNLRLEDEERYLLAFRVARRIGAMQLWLQDVADPADIAPLWASATTPAQQ